MIYAWKDRLYELVVGHHPDIKRAYEGYVDRQKALGRRKRLRAWLYLLSLNAGWFFLKKAPDLRARDEEGGAPIVGEAVSLEPPERLAKRLLQYDVISFDIFDTLLFRPFSDPKDLFYLVGEQLGLLNFRHLRVEAERKARLEQPSGEVTLAQIYAYLEAHDGIDARAGMEAEEKAELALCAPNPYMKRVFDLVLASGKPVVALSDMYLPGEMVQKLLAKCGYTGFAGVYLSCDHGLSKHRGDLYRLVRRRMGERLCYVHVGDNPVSDVLRASQSGFEAVHYPNINTVGNSHRTTRMSPIVGSAYRGIINAMLHSGQGVPSTAYEYGAVCGGLMALGYCRFIHAYAQTHQMDKVLFLSRDGEILKKVYDLLYPGNNSAYAYWSRRAALKLSAHRSRRDYLTGFITHKIGTGSTVRDTVRAMGVEVPLEKARLPWDAPLTERAAAELERALMLAWDQVLAVYRRESELAKAYYATMLKGCERACAVDIGWAGSGAIALMNLAEKDWMLPCKLFGLLAGTNTPHFPHPDAAEAFLQSGRLAAYLYAQSFNREWMFSHHPGNDDNVYMEMLMASREGSFIGFDPACDGMLVFDAPEEENAELIADIQRGILDFVKWYNRWFQEYPYMLRISGNDAYAPFRLAADNRAYMQAVLADCTFQKNIGGKPGALFKGAGLPAR